MALFLRRPIYSEVRLRLPGTRLRREKGSPIWRYRKALPIEEDRHIVSFQEGFTPLVADCIEGINLWWKLEYVAATGSVKDRGTSVLISGIKEMGIDRVIEDSSGNAGASVAAYCARAKIGACIFVPARTSLQKKRRIAAYGGELREVAGTREQVAEAAYEEAARCYYASQTWNPYFIHGTKA